MKTFLRRTISCLLLSALLFGEAFALTITEVRVRDLDNNGQIDRLNVRFDEDLDPATVAASDFTISGYTIASASIPGANPNRVNVFVNESGNADTDATPTVGIAATQSITDILTNTLDDSFPGIVSTDFAKPVVLTLSTTNTTGNYKMGDTFPITATLSEPVVSGNITLNFDNGQSLVLNATGANTVSGTYTVVDGDDTADLSVASHTNTLQDAASQLAETAIPIFGSAKTLAIDTVNPVVTEITAVDTFSATNTPTYTFNTSEAGTITYAGNCSSTTNTSLVGDNTIPFNTLPEGLHNNCTITVADLAGNAGTVNVSDFTIDTIAPVVDSVSILSNNALDTELAKTNDTITVSFTFTEGTSNVQLNNTTILGNGIIETIDNTSKTGNIARFTTGVETSEVVTSFTFQLEDEAGNMSSVITATTDGTTVRFDRTDPMIDTVGIVATSQDVSAFTGDLPTYYAKQGDSMKLSIQAMDYVDVLSMSGTLFGQPVNLVNTAGSTWEVEQTSIDGAEGIVSYSILVTDNAGNEVTVTGPTTANNQVIFDKTIPDLPTTTIDLEGDETQSFKHRSKASYTWSGQDDLDATDTFTGSGIQDYRVRYHHGTFGALHDLRVSHPTTSFTPNQLTPDDDPYFLFLNVRDKAGNETFPLQAYAQRYSVGIIGAITDLNGTPLNDAVAQLVARFNDTCNTSVEVCTDITITDGKFFIVAQKQRDYTLSAWNRQHHMAKTQVRVELDDVTVNFKLNLITSPHETQGGNQAIIITTNKIFQPEENVSLSTEILVGALSGEITTTQIDPETIQVTSLSRITSVSSSNPDVQITSNGRNTFTIRFAGAITGTHSLGNTEKNAVTTSQGTDNSFVSGTSRIGTEFLFGNGKGNVRLAGSNRSDFIGTGAGISYEESLAYAAKLNEGTKAKTNSYINRNGFVVFSGYQNGRMALNRFKHRHQNTVSYRGGFREPWQKYERVETTNPGGRAIVKYVANETLAEKTMAMKARYQKDQNIRKERMPGSTPNTKEAYVTYGKKDNHHGLGRIKNDQISAVITKKEHDKQVINRFERKRMFPHSAGESRLMLKDQNTIRFKGSRGSIAVGDLFEN